MYQLPSLISITPVIRSSNAVLTNEEVFRVVDILVRPGLDTVDYLVPCALVYCILVHSIHGKGYGGHTRGSRSIKIARGMYRVSSD
jgi:hypothetical protein